MGSRRIYDSVLVDNNSSGSGQSGDFSMLNDIEEGSYHNGDIQVNYDFTNMHSALNETTHDSNAEVSLKLTQLISENLSLKEALNKNNLMMKEQLSTIPAWRDVMISKTKQQEQNLQDAKDMISSLKKENENLQKKLDNLLKEKSQNGEMKDSCTKCENLESTLNSLFGEKDFTKEERRSILFNELNSFHENLEQNLITICHLLNAMLNSKMVEKERNLLKTFILLLKFKIASVNGSFCATDEETGYEVVHQLANKEESKECTQVNSGIQKKLEELQEIIKMKDEEMNLLIKEKDQLHEKLKIYDLKIQDVERTSKAKFEILSRQLEMESSASAGYKEQCEKQQEQLDEYQEKLHRAKMSGDRGAHEYQKIQDLEEILKIEQRVNQKDKEELSRLRTNCEKMQVDYERVTKLLEIVSRDEKEKIEKLQKLNADNEKSYLEQIDRLTAQLMEVQDELTESNTEKEKLSHVAEESETIPALKAQIQVYKADYLTTVTEKNAALDEIERLNKELEKFQEKSGSSNSSPSPLRHNGSLNTSTRGHRNEGPIACPVCSNEFTSMRAAQNHIERCIEQNE